MGSLLRRAHFESLRAAGEGEGEGEGGAGGEDEAERGSVALQLLQPVERTVVNYMYN